MKLHNRKRFYVGQQKTVKEGSGSIIREAQVGTKVLGLLVSLVLVLSTFVAAAKWMTSDRNLIRPEAAPQQVTATQDKVVNVNRIKTDPQTVAAIAVIGTLVIGLCAYDVVLARQ